MAGPGVETTTGRRHRLAVHEKGETFMSRFVFVSAVAIAWATAAGAQTTAEQDDDIVVTASRNPTAVSEVAGSISVLSKERLDDQLSVSTDLNDVLGRAIPGLVANNETSFSGSTGPIIRGRPASVLINGVPVNQLLRSSGFDLGLIDPIAIERLEVNRGASAVFGFGASGGVINLITRRGRTADPEVVMNVATSFNPKEIGDSLSGRAYVGVGAAPGNGFDYYIGGGYTRARPTHDARGRKNTSQDTNAFNIDANFGYTSGDKEFRITADFFRRDFNQEYLNPAYTYGICETDECTTLVLPAGLEQDYLTAQPQPFAEVKKQYQQNIIVNGNYKDADFFGQALDISVLFQQNKLYYAQVYSDGGAPPTLSLYTSPMTNERFGVRTALTAEIPLGFENPLELTYGFDYISDFMIRTSEFGGSIGRPVLFNPGINPLYATGAGNQPISPPVGIKGYAGFAQMKLKTGNLVLTGGIRHEEARPYARPYTVENVYESGEDLVYNGGPMQPFSATLFNAGIVYSVAESSEIYAGLSQGVEISELGRAYTDLADIGSPGDPRLVNARASITTQYEIGFRHNSGPLNATAAVFYTNAPLSALTVDDPDPACDVIGADPCPVINLRQREKIWGVEATLDYNLSSQFSLGGVLTYQNGKFRRDDDPDPSWQRLTSDRVTPARLTAYVEYRPTEALKAKLVGTQSFRRGGFGPDIPLVPVGPYDYRTNVPGFFLLDALVEFKTFGGTLYVSGENILNKRYLPPLTKVINDLYYATYAEGARVTIGFKRTF
jgi:iron complex outermembrane receptor protein